MTTAATPGAPGEGTPPADAGKNGEGTTPAGQQPGTDGKTPDGQKPAGSLFEGDGTPPADDKDTKPGSPDGKPLDPNDPNAWLLAEGVMGNGARPEWFKSDKYANVMEQAKAYGELEKRFGSFTGAPKDGKYAVPSMPEGVQGEFLTDHPVFGEFTKWAGENQLSQKGYDSLLGLLAQYEQSQAPDIAAIKQSLGTNADARIGAVMGWAKANLSAEQMAVLKEVGSTAAAGQVLQLMEAVIDKARKAATPPRVGDDAAAASAALDPLAAARKAHAKRDANGKLLYDTDPKYRAEVEGLYRKAMESAQ